VFGFLGFEFWFFLGEFRMGKRGKIGKCVEGDSLDRRSGGTEGVGPRIEPIQEGETFPETSGILGEALEIATRSTRLL
jgi:hypothetical protein